uniref:Neuroendocrine convertase 2 n=1 Tax=Meloidogyne incognita TaxID=6306 RepID=A0A914NCE1_MELIC
MVATLLLIIPLMSEYTLGIEVFTNHFLVHLNEPGIHNAHKVAKRNGFINRGPLLGSDSEYHFVQPALSHARTRRSIGHHAKLSRDPHIKYVEQMTGYKRLKRGYRPLADRLQEQLDFTAVHSPSDPLYQYQWYLKNDGQSQGKPRLDLNVEKAWALGYTGKNITTAIMDDGVDYMHPDLKLNFNAEASYDFSSNDPYPYPRYTDDWFNSHGTRCAGEISAARDNGVCGVGVAYDSKVAGIRMLDQPYMTDLIEANSMGHEPNKIHIYSASWGPTDDGKTVDGPRNATMRAIVKGVNEGRNGLGSIFVWASGDGGEDDDCNCDGYAASMWTISINSAINNGENAHYDESCSSTLASTFSNGGRNPESGVATTDLYGRCTRSHSGTSAAAPEAAGVFALALEANPNLSWRDLQHLTVLTSSRNSLFDGRCRELPPLNLKGVTRQLYKGLPNCSHFEWQMNGVGLEYNHLFGYGVLDAAEIVLMAKVWKTMPPRFHCEAGTIEHPTRIPPTGDLVLELNTDACVGTSTEVNFLEHVQAIVSLNTSRRGDTTLYLISPMGTPSMLLSRRPKDDDSKDGFTNWPFMTTHTWGENPRGKWRLVVRFQSGKSTPVEQQKHHTGWLKKFSLMLHGTKEAPYVGIEPLQGHANSKLSVVQGAHKRMA